MNTRSRSHNRFVHSTAICFAVVVAASSVLPACKTVTEGMSKESVAKLKSRRDPDVRLVSDEQPVAEAPAPVAGGPAVAAGAPGAVPLPAPPNYAKTIPGRPAKPIAGAKLPALPRDYEYAANCAPPIPYGVVTPWAPPGIKGPWPSDEYLHDGGDAEEPVAVSPEWRVQGLNVEDTVAHYDTIDGRTLVEQSNCTYIYAPRFSSVRQVSNVFANEFVDGPTKIVERERVTIYDERARVGTKLEQQQPVGQTANVKLGNYRREQGINIASTTLIPNQFIQTYLAFENLSVIRSGTMVGSEKARLAERNENAIVWSKADGVKIILDKQKAAITQGDKRAQAIFVVKGPTDARLRVCKIASTPAAQPGEIVDFTIRYDNIGDTPVGNVVILDSLTTRLSYVPDSAQSSRAAQFNAVENSAESLELRWEIDEVIKPGEGGIVRFKCVVR